MEPPPTASDDEALAARAQDGDLDAFEALVVRHGTAVVTALERLTGDHHQACDAAQDAWVKVHRALPRYRRGAAFRPWLFAIALNQGRDHLRARGRRRALGEVPLEQAGAGRAIDPAAAIVERGAIASALAEVDAAFRDAVVLVDVVGLGYGEAAVALDCAEGTVKSRVHRGRLAFRDAYERLTAPPKPSRPRPIRGGTV